MKKMLFALICTASSVAVMAQTKPTVILKGGVNFANITESTDGKVDDAK